MSTYKRYGIEVGQVYVPADGSKNRLTVRDVETYSDCDDVVVFDEIQGIERRIDAFKLAKVRYSLQPSQA
jgi:nucleoside-triphosphatase THEP1